MKIMFLDNGQVINANSPVDMVSQMRNQSQTSSKNNFDYMLQYARRAVIYQNQDIRATSEEEFFEDILNANHIQILGFGKCWSNHKYKLNYTYSLKLYHIISIALL